MLKQFLFGVAAFSLAVSAAAADITNPFYLPTKGQVGSITSAAFRKIQEKDNRSSWSRYDKIVREDVQYGLTDALALVAGLGNTFAKGKTNGYVSETRDANLNWRAGLAWNILKGAAKLQVAANYGQDRLGPSVKGEYKYVDGEIKAGYQFKKFLTYISVGEELPVAQTNGYGYDKPKYNAKIGLYQGECEKWALDTGIRWVHSEQDEQRGYMAEAEASYYLTPKSAVSIYGTYLLDGKATGNTDMYDKSVGVRLRWFF